VTTVCVTVKNDESKMNFTVNNLRKKVTNTYHAVHTRIDHWSTCERKISFN